MKECVLYKKEEKDKVRCRACAHKCLILDGEVGVCGVRKNFNGKLYLMVYGSLVAVHVDPIEKKPLYHFLPGTFAFSIGTVGCNFKCGFCQNYDISQLKTGIVRQFSPKQIVEQAIENKCKAIAYTYNEPTIFAEFVKDVAKLANKKGLKNVLVTNGYMTEECLEFLAPYIDAMNIDLKAFSNEFYSKLCKAKLAPVLATIKNAHKRGIWIEITTLIVPDENDSKSEIEKIAKFISAIDKNIPWHLSRFFPMYEMNNKTPTEIKKIKEAQKIGKKYLNYIYVGNIPEESSTICLNCGKELIKRIGYHTENRMIGVKCPYCKRKIPGVFG